MRTERYTYIAAVAAVLVAVVGMLAGIAEVDGFSPDSKPLYIGAIFASAYAAVVSIYFTRNRERKLRQKRIFIIYSYADVEAARVLTEKLKNAGFHPWFDQDEILPGQRITESRLTGLMGSAAALLLVSSNLKADKSMVRMELDFALRQLGAKDSSFSPVIPVRLDDTPVPEELAGVNWVNFKKSEDFDRLNTALKRIVES